MKKHLETALRVMRRHHLGARTLSMILSLVLLFFVAPLSLHSAAIEALTGSEETSGESETVSAAIPEEEGSISAIRDVYEVTDLRDEYTKIFHLEDGTYLAAQYDAPVHMQNTEGKWMDINNALADDGAEYATSNARIKFSKKITGNGSLYTLHDGSAKLTVSLIDAQKKTTGTVFNGSDAEEDTELQKMLNLENLSSRIVYENILDGVDIEYVVHSMNIKENIIVKERQDRYSYTFELALNGLTAELGEDGAIRLYHTRTKELQYRIPAPFVTDAEYAMASPEEAYYTLVDQGNGKYRLTVTVSSEWMNAPERIFPVTVDPTLVLGEATDFIDLYVKASAPTQSFSSSTTLPVYENYTSFCKSTNLSAILEGAYIVSADLYLTTAPFLENQIGSRIGVFDVLEDWDATMTYNTMPTVGTMVDYQQIEYSGMYSWDITDLCRKWIDGSNFGVALKPATGEETTSSMEFWSSESLISRRPKMVVSYIDMKGIEPYWSYSSQDAGLGGTASINLATGKMSLAIPTLTTTDSLFGFTPTLVYNSDLANKKYISTYAEIPFTSSYLPYGFKLNTNETIVKKSYNDIDGNNIICYVYADGDGTEHTFYSKENSTTEYVDEDGLQKVLTVQSATSITLTDDSKNIYYFSKMSSCPSKFLEGWYLTKIEDRSGNALIITVDTSVSSYRPTKISVKANALTAIDMLTFYYNSGGALSMIYNSASKDAVVFRYSTYCLLTSITASATAFLRRIDYAHGNSSVTDENWTTFRNSTGTTPSASNISLLGSAQYTYTYVNSAGQISVITDKLAAQKLTYTISEGKYTSVTHAASTGSTTGQKILYNYGTKTARIRSSGSDDIINNSDDIFTYYTFDGRGRAVSSYSCNVIGNEIYGATVGSYEEQDNIKNNIKEKTVLGGTSVNYLLNGDFEDNASGVPANWYISGACQVYGTTTYTGGTGKKLKFSPAAGATASAAQYVYLQPGTYTLSMQLKSQNAADLIGTASVTSFDGLTSILSEQIPLNPNISNGIESFFSASFTLDAAQTVKISISFSADTGSTQTPYVYVSGVSLENMLGASEFSMVEYGSFEASGRMSDNTVSKSVSAVWNYDTENSGISTVADSGPFGDVLKIQSTFGTQKYVKQKIYTADASLLFAYDYDASSFYSNANNEYLLSGFAKGYEAVASSNASFRLRVDIVYYQGNNHSSVTRSLYFDFDPAVDDWQFLAASFTGEYAKEAGDTNDYSCVEEIWIGCEFSGQLSDAYALFDNISVVRNLNTDTVRNYYNINGLLVRKENIFYIEYYEYDSNRNLTRVANNRGELTDYTYDSKNRVTKTITYDFTWNSGYLYPYLTDNPDNEIVKTPKSRTQYTYNSYGLCTQTLTEQVEYSGTSIVRKSGTYPIKQTTSYRTTSGSRIFGAEVSTWDPVSGYTYYRYDTDNGRLLATVNASSGDGICYTYDDFGNLLTATPASYVSNSYTPVTNAEEVEYTYNAKNLLESISTESTTYNFTYDAFGNTTAVKVGTNNTLALYTYAPNNGKLQQITYGNGYSVRYAYDSLDNVQEIWYTVDGNEEIAFRYEYTAKGQLYKVTDERKGVVTVYRYDDNDRLTSTIQYGTGDYRHEFSSEVYYNDKGQLSSVYHKLNHPTDETLSAYLLSYFYAYDTESRVTQTKIDFGSSPYTFSNAYDDFGRLTSQSRSYSGFTGSKTYTYLTKTVSSTTYATGLISSLVNTMGNTTNTYAYTYDSKGNITKITENNAVTHEYAYDDMNQLIRENNAETGHTILYIYDNAGNMTSRKEYTTLFAMNVTPSGGYQETVCEYQNSNFGDLVTKCISDPITCDALGNPIDYSNRFERMEFSWEGRRLKTAEVYNAETLSFAYDDKGLRTEKTVDNVTHRFYYDGTRLISEEWNNNILYFLYDYDGAPVGMRYHASSYNEDVWDVFWYETNIQGDIVAIYNSSGTKLVTYHYLTAFGEQGQPTYTNGGQLTGAIYNPLTYRGYYYDSEIGMYYLQSRYYDPYMCRFLNADGYVNANGDILGHNMFAYCDNNPVNYSDPTGNFPWFIVISIITVVITSAIIIKKAYDEAKNVSTLIEMYEDMDMTTKAQYVVANEVFNKAVNPEYVIDTSGIADIDKTLYIQQISSVAEIIRSVESSGTVPAYTKLKNQKIKSFGLASPEDAEAFMLEVGSISTMPRFNYAKGGIISFVKKGVELLQSTIRWGE